MLSMEVQLKRPDVLGFPARNEIQASGPNGKVVMDAIKDVQVVQIDWNHVLDKQKAWQERWKSEVIGNDTTKKLDVVKPN